MRTMRCCIAPLLILLTTTRAFLTPQPRCSPAKLQLGMLGSNYMDSLSAPRKEPNDDKEESPANSRNDPPKPVAPVEPIAPVEPVAPPEPDEPFGWFKSWYPIVPVDMLDMKIPHRFQLLNMDIVVWNDGAVEQLGRFGFLFGTKQKKRRENGKWRVFVDECPHRKVPLSQGRVQDDGSLFCSYHGYRYNGNGTLMDVPQLAGNKDQDGFIASQNEQLQKLRDNPDSRCNAFPAQVIDGLLWVWPVTGEDAHLEAALKTVPVGHVAETADQDTMWVDTWNYREMPYSVDYLMENVLDPAHLTISHHGVLGNCRYGDQTSSMKVVNPLSSSGFAIESEGPLGKSVTTFKAPSTVIVNNAAITKGAMPTLEFYASPSRPGFCNKNFRLAIKVKEGGTLPFLLRKFKAPVPKWINHVMAPSFFNQDAMLLHRQERNLAKTGAYSTVVPEGEEPKQYSKGMLEAETDKGVLNYRNWLRQLADGRIPYKYNPVMPEVDESAVFDQWNSHTKHCRMCLGALRNLKRLRFISLFAAICLAVIRPFCKTWMNLASVLTTTGIAVALTKGIGKFHRYEFSHGHKD